VLNGVDGRTTGSKVASGAGVVEYFTLTQAVIDEQTQNYNAAYGDGLDGFEGEGNDDDVSIVVGLEINY